jgi:hypothetical protein
MTEPRKWWPESYVDEITPEGRSSPSDWLRLTEHDPFKLDRCWQNGQDTPLAAGQVVNFVYADDLGTIRLTINPDSTYLVNGAKPPIPGQVDFFRAETPNAPLPPFSRANAFWVVGDPDTYADDISQFVADYLHNEPLEEPRVETVALAYWSDSIPHAFVVDDKGARFVPTLKTADELVAYRKAVA